MVDNRFFFNHKTDGYMPVRNSKKYFSFLSDKSFEFIQDNNISVVLPIFLDFKIYEVQKESC